MIIGFDGKRAVNNMTGLGNYSRLVIEELGKRLRHDDALAGIDVHTPAPRHAPADQGFGMYTSQPVKSEEVRGHRLYVYAPEMRRNPRLEPIHRLENVEFRFPPETGFKGSLWRTFGVTNNIAADRCALFHGLSNELPLNIRSSRVKSVVTIHDLIYRRLPYCYTPQDRLIYNFKYGRACRNADRIIAVSECTKRDIIDLYQIPEEKIDVVYQGCNDIFRRDYPPRELQEVRQRLQLPERYIIQVGTVERRKNLELGIRALTALPSDITLLSVGRDHHGYLRQMRRLAADLGVADRVIYLEQVDFIDLPALYAMAEVSLYPSRYEGFGIPVIEALECGTPVVAATGSCLEEAGGPGALYVDPDDPRGMAQALNDILGHSEKRTELAGDGKTYVRRFNTASMTDNILQVYRKTLSSQKVES